MEIIHFFLNIEQNKQISPNNDIFMIASNNIPNRIKCRRNTPVGDK